MSFIKKQLLVMLLMLPQSSVVFSSEPVVYVVDKPSVRNSIKLLLGLSTFLLSKLAYVKYNNYLMKEEVDVFKKIGKSLSNVKINPADDSEAIAKKWGMKGWRLKGGKFTYAPNISISDAHYIYLHEPEVVECLYNDLKFRDIYLIENKELIKFKFDKPEKSAYKAVHRGEAKAITVMNLDEIPSVSTLQSVKSAIDADIKDLLSKMKKIEGYKPFADDKLSFEKILIGIAKDYQKAPAYKYYIKNEKTKLESKNDISDEYKAKLVKILSEFQTTEIDDISDLYLFSHDHLLTDTSDLKSIKTQFLDECKKKVDDDNDESSWYKAIEKFVRNQIVDPAKNNLPRFAGKMISVGWRNLNLDKDASENIFKEMSKAYFEVAVSYARLVQLQKTVSKLINMVCGNEDSESAENKLKKNKENINKKINDIISKVNELKNKDPKDVNYIYLRKLALSILKCQREFVAFDLVEIYRTAEVNALLNSVISKITKDLQSVSTYFTGGQAPARNNDFLEEDDLFGIGFNHRPVGKANIYDEGCLNEANVTSLRKMCNGWLLGLKELDEQTKNK